uniref:Transcription initiation factor TFIID subunit 13 n=1 Tax=Panagrolaimus sp. PS1159 TaxID=55785 RepID=A0AC35GYJ4_9BILA
MENLPIAESSLFEEEISEESTAESNAKFRRELKAMLFGFGDVKNPIEATVELLNQIIVDYIISVAKCGQSLDPRK